MNGSVLLIGCFVLFLLLNVPIAMSIGLSTVVYCVATGNMSLSYLATGMFTTVNSFPIMAVPFFILAGALMEGGGLSSRLVNLSDSLVGHFTGGAAIVTIVTCMFFGAISGSAAATVAAIGSIMVPTMISRGYDRKFSVALVAAAGCLGCIIPPSIPMVMFGVATNASVGGMFMGGIVPGIVCAGALIVVSVVISHKKGYVGNGQKFSFKAVLTATREAIWALLVPVIILGGIYGGIFTPTEAAAIAAVYGLIAGAFLYKELTWEKFINAVTSSTTTVGSVIIIVGTATTLGRAFTLEQVPQQLAAAIGGLTDNILVLMLIINLLLLLVGCVMETTAAILIMAPILYPIVAPYGIEAIHFGVMMVINLAVGLVTPPVGVNLFVAAGIGEINFTSLVKSIIPFLITLFVVLILIVYIPGITMLLPHLFGF